MGTRGIVVFFIVFAVFLFASSALYTIKESERGIKKQFGRVIDPDLKPGLGIKLPIIHEIQRFDGRVIGLDLRSEEYITQEKKRLIVDSYLMWKIKDVGLFYTSTGGSISTAQRLLAPRVNEGLRNKFGERTVYEVVSGEREQLMVELTKQVNDLTVSAFGIEIIDIRVKRIDLPPNVSGAVYERMRAEREREAREHRSKGKELAEGIRADADRQVRIVLAEAYQKAEVIKGEGDAKAASTYAQAYGADPEFYEFYRSLLAYRNTFGNKDDVMLLSPKSEFFDYLKGPKLGR